MNKDAKVLWEPVEMKLIEKVVHFIQVCFISKFNFELSGENGSITKVKNNRLCEHSEQSTSEVNFYAVDFFCRNLSRPQWTAFDQLAVWVGGISDYKMMSMLII